MSISELPLKSFIKAVVNDDISVLCADKTATTEQLTPIWEDILSQYYSARGDVSFVDYMTKTTKLMVLKCRLTRMDLLFTWLEKDGYTETICAILRAEYKLPFTKESYLQDCDTARKKDIRAIIDHDRLEKEIKAQNDKAAKKISKEQQEESFYQMVFNINQVEKSAYSVATLTTYEYAIACKRYDKYIETLENK